MSATPLSVALACAARGWPVFPCKADKTPLTAHGFQDATTDEATIKAWWQAHPRAQVGIATGAAGLVVVDIDVKNGAPGLTSWAALVDELGPEITNTAISRTLTGGFHIYYRANGHTICCSQGVLAEAVDVRAPGGYVIAYPSGVRARPRVPEQPP